jgi:hypothetical protein
MMVDIAEQLDVSLALGQDFSVVARRHRTECVMVAE